MKAVSTLFPVVASLAFASATPMKRAGGELEYFYQLPGGTRIQASLKDPNTGECVNIPDLTGAVTVEPVNRSDNFMIAYSGRDCGGGTAFALDPNSSPDAEVAFRSVLFLASS